MAITLRQRFLKKGKKKRKKTLSTESLNTLLVRELFSGTLKMVTSFILSIPHGLKIWEFISPLALKLKYSVFDGINRNILQSPSSLNRLTLAL